MNMKNWKMLTTYGLLFIVLTFVQAFIMNTFADLVFADSLWRVTLLISAIMAGYFVYTHHQTHECQNCDQEPLLRWWIRITTHMLAGSIIYWILLLLSGSPLIASIGLVFAVVALLIEKNEPRSTLIRGLFWAFPEIEMVLYPLQKNIL